MSNQTLTRLQEVKEILLRIEKEIDDRATDSPKLGEWFYYETDKPEYIRGVYKFKIVNGEYNESNLNIFNDGERQNFRLIYEPGCHVHRPATESEIKEFLIKYCDSVYKGKKFAALFNGGATKYGNDFEYKADTSIYGKDVLFCNGNIIYADGKFAEVVEEEKIVIAGRTGYFNDNRFFLHGAGDYPWSFTKEEIKACKRILKMCDEIGNHTITLKEVEQILKGFEIQDILRKEYSVDRADRVITKNK